MLLYLWLNLPVISVLTFKKAASWNLLYRKRKERDIICNTRKKRKLKCLLMKRKTLRTGVLVYNQLDCLPDPISHERVSVVIFQCYTGTANDAFQRIVGDMYGQLDLLAQSFV